MRRLKAALALSVGMDSFIVLQDVCWLKDDEAQDVLRWAACTLLRAGVAEAGQGGRRGRWSAARR